jgi:hypothetical protein
MLASPCVGFLNLWVMWVKKTSYEILLHSGMNLMVTFCFSLLFPETDTYRQHCWYSVEKEVNWKGRYRASSPKVIKIYPLSRRGNSKEWSLVTCVSVKRWRNTLSPILGINKEHLKWGTRWLSWSRHRATRQEVPGSISCCLWKISNYLILLSAFSSPEVHSVANRN